MNLKSALTELSSDTATRIAKNAAMAANIGWSAGIGHVFRALTADPMRAPGRIGSRSDDAVTVLRKWVTKYQRGFEQRPSQRHSNLPGTVPDPLVEKLLVARLGHLSADDLVHITAAHRLEMSAENILGAILEEYLAGELKPYRWHCAWGETVAAVDFVNEDGRLLQVKNRSNSENSSSSAIRDGTSIIKWYRIEATSVDYRWGDLSRLSGAPSLSEEKFKKFATHLIKANPRCLAVEPDNAWSTASS